MQKEKKMAKKSIDRTVNTMLEKTSEQGVETIWDRSDQQKARCGFGEQGLCCRACYMGPCRIHPKGKGAQYGVCGASAEVIVSRNFARMVAAGASAHSDHGREVAKTLLLAAESADSGYTIKDMKPHPGLKPRVSALWHNLVMASLTDRGCTF